MFSATKSSGPSGYKLTRSLRFRSSASAYLNRTPSAGTRTTWTLSLWLKRGALSAADVMDLFCARSDDNNYTRAFFDTTSTNVFYFRNAIAGVATANFATTQVFRDPSAWYHVVITWDTTQATSTNRVKIYVNGSQITAFTTATYPALNENSFWNGAYVHNICNYPTQSRYYDGYLAEVNFIDGQALTPSSFGSTNSTTGVWQPAKYGGTYGTNGFYLPFTDNSALTTSSNAGLGKDFSGNANYWVTNNISITAGTTYDSMTDVPTLTSATAANYPVANPLWKEATTTITNGNLNVTGGNQGGFSTMAMPTGGKFYCEATVTTVEGYQGVGIVKASAFSGSLSSASLFGSSAYSYYAPSGNKYVLNTSSAYGSAWGTVGDVIGIAADLSANTLTFYKNNVSQGAITIDGGIDYFFGVSNAGVDGAVAFNYGQQPFAYTPPTGFIRLNTYNIAASTVPNGAAYMAATLYTGNGSTQSVVNTVGSVSFQPDFVWLKNRSSVGDHGQYDSVRGTTKRLVSNKTIVEDVISGVTAFNSNGFSLGADYNVSPDSFVAWNWKAGGTAVSNTNGTITSSVSANTTSGFSVVTYTGVTSTNVTVGHGLGVAPSMIIVKSRSLVTGWYTYHVSLPNTQFLALNTTQAATNGGDVWNSTTPTSSVFNLGTNGNVNQTATFVAYCFAAIKGFSAFGSYTGNYSTNGTFVYTGFKPRFILIKCINTTYEWEVIDTTRSTYNGSSNYLQPNLSNAEYSTTTDIIDILSNGFKLRTDWTRLNDTYTYIYMAFAESPFQNSLAR